MTESRSISVAVSAMTTSPRYRVRKVRCVDCEVVRSSKIVQDKDGLRSSGGWGKTDTLRWVGSDRRDRQEPKKMFILGETVVT